MPPPMMRTSAFNGDLAGGGLPGWRAARLDFDHLEVALPRRAVRAGPGFGDVLPARAGGDAFLGPAGCLVVDERAEQALQLPGAAGGRAGLVLRRARAELREVQDDRFESART